MPAPKKPGYRFLRFVEGALIDAMKAPDGENRHVSYHRGSNFDRYHGADVADYITQHGWGVSTGFQSFTISDDGRTAGLASVRRALAEF